MTAVALPPLTESERKERDVRAIPFGLPPIPGDRMHPDAVAALAQAKVLSTINAWYSEERWRIPTVQRGGIVLGAVVYGQWYLDMLANLCLPTLLAPDNREALQDATIVLYTDKASKAELREIVRPALFAGIDAYVHVIPDAVLKASDRPFLSLAAAQQLLVTQAARIGASFHQLAPDHGYSQRYMPNLRRLGAIHRNVAHGGLNVYPLDLERFRADGALVVPARDLTTIGWKHHAMCPMNDTAPDRMPDQHYQVYRARDRVMLFNPYPNPAYITSEMCRALDVPTMTTATLDCHTKELFRSDVYVPTVEDDMAFVSVDHGTQPAVAHTSMAAFLARMWREIAGEPELLAYYTRPTEMAAAIDETVPTAEEVMAQQSALVDMAVERSKEAA
jgi:hypothetical protein